MTGMMARREGLPVEVLLEAPEVQNLGVLAAGGWHREHRSGRERERERERERPSRRVSRSSGRDGTVEGTHGVEHELPWAVIGDLSSSLRPVQRQRRVFLVE